MKKVDIPIIERENNGNNIDNLIKAANDLLNNNIQLKNKDSKISNDITINFLYQKCISEETFTKEDLIYLYDIYNKQVLTDEERQLVWKIKQARNIKEDMSIVFDCSPSEVAIDRMSVIFRPNDYVVLLDDLVSAFNNDYSKLKYISGNLVCCTQSNYLYNLQIIGGNVDISNLKYVPNFKNLKYIGKNILANRVENADGLYNLEYIGGDAAFSNLTNATALNNLVSIDGDAIFESLEDSKGLESLRYIGGNANFKNLRNARGLSSLEWIMCDAWFNNLRDVTGLNRLKYIDKTAIFPYIRDKETLASLAHTGDDSLIGFRTKKILKKSK